jgi:hypothetical protein
MKPRIKEPTNQIIFMYIYLTRCDIDRGYVGNPKDVGGKCERSDGKY